MIVQVVITSDIEEIRVENEITAPVRDFAVIQEHIQRCANAAQAFFDTEDSVDP